MTIKDATNSDGSPVYVTVTISGNSLTLKIDGVDHTLTKNSSTTKPGNGDDDGEDSDNGDEPPVTGGITDPAGNLTIVDGVVTSCRKEAEGKIVIPDGVTGIKGGVSIAAFYDRKGITEVVIPDSVTAISSYAFYGCSALEKVTIGKNVESIGNRAFMDCKALTSVEIPDSVTTIGKEAFWQCFALESVVIGDGVTTIGDSAFWNSRKLKSLTLGKSVETISDHAFQDCAITSVELPASVRTIGNHAFGESPLESLTLPEGIESIGYSAFYCSSTDGFTSIKIPASVKFISNGVGVFNMAYDAEVEFAVTTGWYYNENYDYYEEKDNEEDWLPVAEYVNEYDNEDWEAKSEEEKLMYLFERFYALKRK